IELALAQSTRAAAVQPNKPKSKNVTSTEIIGDTFNGNRARTVINRNNHGRDKNRSLTAIAPRAHPPPREPASPPTNPAQIVHTRAAPRGSNSEKPLPHSTR